MNCLQKYAIMTAIGFVLSGTGASADEAEKYFPLSVGNVWVYRHEFFKFDSNYHPVLQRTDTLTVRITEKVVIGTVSWYRFAGGIFGNTGLFRNEGNFVHMSDDMGKTDRVFYDFTPWENPEDETSRFMLIDGFCASPRYRKSFETPIGVFEGYQCSFNLCDFHCGRERYTAPGIGIAYMVDSDDIDYAPDAKINKYGLVSAIVNGMRYGGAAEVRFQRPVSFAVFAHPNPFNPTTMVEFVLPRPETVTVAIHDVTGRRVRTLASGPFNAGKHEIRWDGTDKAGLHAASGVYMARVSTSHGTGVVKMLLVR